MRFNNSSCVGQEMRVVREEPIFMEEIGVQVYIRSVPFNHLKVITYLVE